MLYHALTSPVADVTGTVTVYDGSASTKTEYASNIVRPSDWNSAHVEMMNFAGNTVGTSQISGTNLYLAGGNNITLSANGQTVSIVGGAGGGGADGYNIVGVNGNTVGSAETVQFSNSNNVTFGLNGSTITASASYPTQSVQTQASGAIAGTGFTSTTTAGTAVVGTLNTVGLSIGVPTIITNAITTARASTDAIGLNTALTANGLSVTANSSGLSINVPAWITTASPVSHSHNVATTTTNGSLMVVATTNSAGATLAVPPFITTYAAQTADTINLYAVGNSTQLSSTAGVDVRSLSFEGAGIASVGVSNGRVVVSVPSGGGAGDGVNVVQIGTTGTSGTAFSSISGTVQLNGSNGIIVSQNNSNQIVISYQGNNDVENVLLTGNTAGNSSAVPSNSLYLQGGNNITLSGTSNTIVISAGAAGGGGAPAVYWDNYGNMPLSVTRTDTGGIHHRSATSIGVLVVPLDVPAGITGDVLKVWATYGGTSTTVGTTNGASGSLGGSTTHNYTVYSRGTGGSSTRLESMYSNSATAAWSHGFSANATAGSVWSMTQGVTYFNTQGTSSSSQSLGTSSTVLNFTNSYNNFPFLGAARHPSIPFSTSLSAGNYALAIQLITSSSTANSGSVAGMSTQVPRISHYGRSNLNGAAGEIGAFPSVADRAIPFNGTITAGTSNSSNLTTMAISAISTAAIPFSPHMNIVNGKVM